MPDMIADNMKTTLTIDHLELRLFGDFQAILQQEKNISTWCHTPHTFKTGLRRPLPVSVDTLWAELSAKVRNQIRKAQR